MSATNERPEMSSKESSAITTGCNIWQQATDAFYAGSLSPSLRTRATLEAIKAERQSSTHTGGKHEP